MCVCNPVGHSTGVESTWDIMSLCPSWPRDPCHNHCSGHTLHTHTHLHTHLHTHTYTHTHSERHTHAHRQTHTHTHTNAHTRTHTHTCTHIHMHRKKQTTVNKGSTALFGLYVQEGSRCDLSYFLRQFILFIVAYSLSPLSPDILSHTHTHTHTHIISLSLSHTHTHTHTHTHIFSLSHTRTHSSHCLFYGTQSFSLLLTSLSLFLSISLSLPLSLPHSLFLF